jgi:uncharacterized protein (DUF736 family)
MSKTTRVGVGWKKTLPDGKEIVSIIVTNPTGPDFSFTLWPNENKQGDFSPDYSVTKQSDAAKREAAPTSRTAAKPAPANDDEEAPF